MYPPLTVRTGIWSILSLLIGMSGLLPLRAQTRFLPPSQSINWARYTKPQLCLAAVYRDTIEAYWGQSRDTLPYQSDAQLPDHTSKLAQRCITAFSIEKAREWNIPALFHLTLATGAGTDSIVNSVIEREYNTIPKKDLAAQAAMLGRTISLLLRNTPVRHNLARLIAAKANALGPTVALQLYSMNVQMMNEAFRAQRFDVVTAEADRLDTLVQNESPGDLGSEAGFIRDMTNLMRYGVAAARGDLTQMKKLMAMRQSVGTSVGRQAPPVVGAYWFNRDGTTPRPTLGRVSLVVFLGQMHFGMTAVLRRLQHEFPMLEITYVVSTLGVFHERQPTSLSQAAEWIRDFTFTDLGLRGALAVDTIPYKKVEIPYDGRIVKGFPETSHSFGSIFHVGNQDLRLGGVERVGLHGFLTDAKGVVIYDGEIDKEAESMLTSLLHTLLPGNPAQATNH